MLIYNARVDSIGLFEYGDGEFNDTIMDLVMRISCISGANLHPNPIMMDLLESELKKALKEFNYMNLSIDEILLAFRLNCVVHNYVNLDIDVDYVELIGNSLNLDYILKVLYNYRKYRHSFERKIQNKLDGYNG